MQNSIELRKLENMDLNSRAAINAAVDPFNNVSGKSSRCSFVVCYIPFGYIDKYLKSYKNTLSHIISNPKNYA